MKFDCGIPHSIWRVCEFSARSQFMFMQYSCLNQLCRVIIMTMNYPEPLRRLNKVLTAERLIRRARGREQECDAVIRGNRDELSWSWYCNFV
jgi:hypothetical protein